MNEGPSFCVNKKHDTFLHPNSSPKETITLQQSWKTWAVKTFEHLDKQLSPNQSFVGQVYDLRISIPLPGGTARTPRWLVSL